MAAALMLTACGGGGTAGEPVAASDPGLVLSIDAAAVPAPAELPLAQPSFHLAPVVLDEPSEVDAIDNTASSRQAPHAQAIPAELAALATRGLTVQALQQAGRAHALAAARALADGTAGPMTAGGVVTTYTPAQIRAAYGLPGLPGAGLTPSAAQAAQLGAGQTIYIVDAMHDLNVVAELAAFNQRFGLPGCTIQAIAPSAALPLAPASPLAGCVLSVVHSTAAGAMTATVPAYDAGWATEIALDVQWAHATAPLARIVLIESASASSNALLGAIRLANAMGSGVVSMSFGAPEGGWMAGVDSAFGAAGMTYLASTGDWGSGVYWPAVSPGVLAVGGTSLTYSGSGPRTETSWSLTGGGISAFTATPAYQANTVPGVGTLARRAVADVAFNADPYTGQFAAIMSPGSPTASWMSVGGTSLSTPQWAGLVAVANALRAQDQKPPLGALHSTLYARIATTPGTYAASFGDVSTGANGPCSTCAAQVGYDIPTGLGTPNVSALLATLRGPPPAAPIVASARVNGKAGQALSFTVAVSAASAGRFALTSAPAGMTISNAGVITWPGPATGTRVVTVTATNLASGLKGSAVVTFVVAQAPVPVITLAALTGVAGQTLAGSATSSSPGGGAVTVSASGLQPGVSVSVNGSTLTLRWPRPVAGKFTVLVTARDAAGLTAHATWPITISADH
ncbi:MAG: S53 family peptidase [Caldimonas sp.]